MALFRTAVFRHPDDVWVNYFLAEALERLHPPAREEAVRYFTAARALRPGTAHDLANLLERMDRGAEAEVIYRDLAHRRPDDPRHLAGLGIRFCSRPSGLPRRRRSSSGPPPASARPLRSTRTSPGTITSSATSSGAQKDPGRGRRRVPHSPSGSTPITPRRTATWGWSSGVSTITPDRSRCSPRARARQQPARLAL